MARMRTLKPEAATSETLTMVPREVRWTLGLLWTHCDDRGRCVLNAKLIKAAIYPLDDDMTPDAILDEIDQLEEIGAVCVYEVDGKQYMHVPAWKRHQHPNRPLDSSLPECPGGEGSEHVQQSRPELAISTAEQRTAPAVNDHAPLTAVLAGKGGAGTGDGKGEGDNHSWSDELTDRFDEFWDVYPKRVAKKPARQRWQTLMRQRVDPQVIIDGARVYARSVNGKSREHIKNPDGWLLGQRYEDDVTALVTPIRDPDSWGYGGGGYDR